MDVGTLAIDNMKQDNQHNDDTLEIGTVLIVAVVVV